MSYERMTTIFDGIAIPEEINLREVFEKFVNSTTNAKVIQSCSEYHDICLHELNGDDLYEYLSDTGHIIYDEFMSCAFLGSSLFTIGRDTGSCSQKIDNLPVFPNHNEEISEFIKLLFPSNEQHRYLINWYL